mgnify:CR=1 FL=1
MKSEKAKSFIDNDAIQMNNGDRMIDASTAYTAVELAEQEAEERMREKAKRAFECVWNATPKQVAEECGISIQEINNEAAAMKYCHQLFIQKLTQNGND